MWAAQKQRKCSTISVFSCLSAKIAGCKWAGLRVPLMCCKCDKPETSRVRSSQYTITHFWEVRSLTVEKYSAKVFHQELRINADPGKYPSGNLSTPDPGKCYSTPDKLHYSQMNVTRFSWVACTGDETMQNEAEAPAECAVWDIHARSAAHKILLSPSGARTRLPQFKLLWYEILIQSKTWWRTCQIKVNGFRRNTDFAPNCKNILHSLLCNWPIIAQMQKHTIS